MNRINTTIKNTIYTVANNEHLKACALRAVTAVAVAALFGAFSLHESLMEVENFSFIAQQAAQLAMKIAGTATVQYAVEKIASKILDKIFTCENAVAKITKFAAPLLLSISASFAFLHACHGLYGFETHYYDWDLDEIISYWDFDSWKEALVYIPTINDGFIFYETWGLKFTTEIAVSLTESAAKAIKSIFNKGSDCIIQLRQRIQAAA